MSFSVEELSKLEALLSALALSPDEASELQAGVINRLMDVYHTLTLQAGAGQVRVMAVVHMLQGAYILSAHQCQRAVCGDVVHGWGHQQTQGCLPNTNPAWQGPGR